ncbi:MAG: ATP-dependent DNA helicase RecG, partial [Maribacter sp.]
DIVKDNDILKTARYYALRLLKDDSSLEKPDNMVIRHSYAQLVKYKNIWNYIS